MLAATIVRHYPLGSLWLLIASLAYIVLIWRWPWLWLILLPTALAALDLAPWSGCFLADEFDALVLLTMFVHYWRAEPPPRSTGMPRLARWAMGALAASYVASLAMAIRPLAPIDAGAFSTYWSPYNALRVAKGFFWALGLAPLIQREFTQSTKAPDRLALGMQLGLLSVGAWVVLERVLFAGLLDFSHTFRVTGPFFGMHVGGQQLDAYLAMALPFTLAASWTRRPSWPSAVWSAGLMALGIYAAIATVSRGAIVAVAVSLLIAAAGRIRTIFPLRWNARRGLIWAAGLTLVVVIIILPSLHSRFLRARFARWREDLDTRWNHWNQSLNIIPPHTAERLFGLGLGSFPRIYAQHVDRPAHAGQFEYRQENGNQYLRLYGGGKNLYFGQQVGIAPYHTYTLLADIRSPHNDALVNFGLHEKNLLYSFRGVTAHASVVGTRGHWESQRLLLHAQDTGLPVALHLRRPVTFAVFPSQKADWIDVDNLRLLDASGRNLLHNGDFSRGNARWFYTSDHHTLWSIFNLWVHLLFEQGLFGLTAFSLYLLAALSSLGRDWRAGDPLAPILAASVIGFLLVGLFGSLLDAPRIALLFFILVTVILTPKISSETRGEMTRPAGQNSLSALSEPATKTSTITLLSARLLAVCVWLNLLGLVALWGLFHFAGDRWWLATLLLFGPRWVYLIPTMMLVIPCLLIRPRLTLLLGPSVLVGIFPLMGLNLGWSRQADPAEPRFRVLTYNIARYNVTEQDFARLLANLEPDAVAVQESSGYVPQGWHVPEGWHVQRAGEMLVASCWPIRRTELSYFGSSKNEGGVVNAMYCVLETPRGLVGFCNIHLDTPRRGLSKVLNREKILDLGKTEYAEQRIELRRQESEEVARWLGQFQEPKIIAGDFNMPVDSTIYRDVWASYQNAFNRTGFGFGYTKQTVIRRRRYGLRIDHVLSDEHWSPTRCWVGENLGSDHLPLVADFAENSGQPSAISKKD